MCLYLAERACVCQGARMPRTRSSLHALSAQQLLLLLILRLSLSQGHYHLQD